MRNVIKRFMSVALAFAMIASVAGFGNVNGSRGLAGALSDNVYANAAEAASSEATPSLKNQVVVVSRDASKATVSWPQLDGVLYYYISVYDLAKYVQTGSQSESVIENKLVLYTVNTYTTSSLSSGGYVISVTPVLSTNLTDSSAFGTTGSVAFRSLTSKVENFGVYSFKPDTGKGVLTFRWSSTSAVDGYEITIYNRKGKKLKKAVISDCSKFTYTYKASKATECYYATMRGYVSKPDGSKLYSKAAQAYAVAQPIMTSTGSNIKEDSFTLKWKKVNGAVSYTIYAKKVEDSKFTKIKTVKASSSRKMVITKIKGTKLDFVKNKYQFMIVTKAKVKGKLKNSKKTYHLVCSASAASNN